MWSAVIYGSSVGSNDIVKVALEQVGNVGGQPSGLGMVLAHELNGVLVLSVGVLINVDI